MSKTLLKMGLVIHSDGQKHEDILIDNDKISAVGDVQKVGSIDEYKSC